MKQINIIGIGPGSVEELSIRAYKALKQSDIIIGYTTYVDLIRSSFPDTYFESTPMTKEIDRVARCVSYANENKSVSLIGSGDSGVYGLAGLTLERCADTDISVQVIPGISALSSGAALLGAPLVHDFACISLSDRLTKWEIIEKRIRYALRADFCLVLYNPRSRSRQKPFQKACMIICEEAGDDRICGIAKNISREKETRFLTTTGQLYNCDVDMFTTIFIGNSQTKQIGNWMVTPRGYPVEREAR